LGLREGVQHQRQAEKNMKRKKNYVVGGGFFSPNGSWKRKLPYPGLQEGNLTSWVWFGGVKKKKKDRGSHPQRKVNNTTEEVRFRERA